MMVCGSPVAVTLKVRVGVRVTEGPSNMVSVGGWWRDSEED